MPPMLLTSALNPTAVLSERIVLLLSAKAPTAELPLPVELLTSVAVPLAVLSVPVAFSKSAATPVGCIVISRVERKRPRTDTRVEAAVGVAKEREPTNCCVRRAGGEVLKSVGPFCRSKVGIASIRRWNNPESSRDCAKCKEAKCQEYCCNCVFHVSILHNLISFPFRFVLIVRLVELLFVYNHLCGGTAHLNFWICAACSLSWAVRISIPFCWATADRNSAIVVSFFSILISCCSTFLCSLRNSLSNIAFTWS